MSMAPHAYRDLTIVYPYRAVLCAKRISVIICADSKENQIDGDAVIEILQNRLSLDFYFQAFAVVRSSSPFRC